MSNTLYPSGLFVLFGSSAVGNTPPLDALKDRIALANETIPVCSWEPEHEYQPVGRAGLVVRVGTQWQVTGVADVDDPALFLTGFTFVEGDESGRAAAVVVTNYPNEYHAARRGLTGLSAKEIATYTPATKDML